jgi:hypothetical protein
MGPICGKSQKSCTNTVNEILNDRMFTEPGGVMKETAVPV